MSADEIIRNIKNKFLSLQVQILWIPYEGNKLDMEGDLFGLKLDMNKLVESQKQFQSGGNCQSQDSKVRDLRGITCFLRHKKWYFQENFPLANKKGASSIK